ncbi:uncharacterized protein [Chelonus insularis]|uniref:uncharacterized protein n=1 Tax=Chelonus insularis TaxID=460826 RepID=UPI00158F16B0|nr:uncharacterized protein LOC118065324 [Chelonus insularis]
MYRQATLPEIPLPTFAGDSSTWTQFRDMFTSLVHDREDLRPVAKLPYLKANVSVPPLQLIRHAVMNDDGYEPAWNQLKSRYDDPEQLIFAHIKDLFSVTTPSSKSAEQLDNLVDVVRQNLDALKALNVPVDSANYFLVYLVASKLEQPLRESWELERSRSRSPTTLDSLLNFISTRARAMESAQDAARQAKRWPTPVITKKSRSQQQSNRQQTTHSQTNRASRHGAQKRQADSPRDQCSSLDHYLVDCKSFVGLSQQDRYKLVLAARLCFNCFGHHSIQVFQSEKRCSTCNLKHHSMIHTPRTESLRKRGYGPGQEPQPTQPGQEPSTSQQ